MDIIYKDFKARILFSAEVGVFYGEILNIRDLLTFQAATLAEAKEILYEMIDERIGTFSLNIQKITEET